ncbi:hypothetical protein ACA910_019669 [Epithemia clementina (nom. ined.)]
MKGAANDDELVKDKASSAQPLYRSRFNIEKLHQLSCSFAEGDSRVGSEYFKDEDRNSGLLAERKSNFAAASETSGSNSSSKEIIRMAVIRYFLDRPGYDLRHSAARIWFHPPAICTPNDVRQFLDQQKIAMNGLLVEIFLDKFKSFMMLDAIEAGFIEWDFSDSSPSDPAILNVRLTDIENDQQYDNTNLQSMVQGSSTRGAAAKETSGSMIANTGPIGLFAFSIVTGLETAALANKLIPGSVQDSYILVWGPYGFFVGGLLQLLVGIFEVFRNNIYGAVAFQTFGCIWLSNGLSSILQTHFSAEDTPAYELLGGSDPWFHFVRVMFIFAFCCVLEIQTWTMNKLSSILVGILCVKLFFHAITPWSLAAEWIDFIVGWILACFAFYVFLVEFTNQVYQRTVLQMYKWSEEHSPEELFGAAGRIGTLNSKAARLRQANFVRMQQGHLREVPPKESGEADSSKKAV